jgi:hypothetical protein
MLGTPAAAGIVAIDETRAPRGPAEKSSQATMAPLRGRS